MRFEISAKALGRQRRLAVFTLTLIGIVATTVYMTLGEALDDDFGFWIVVVGACVFNVGIHYRDSRRHRKWAATHSLTLSDESLEFNELEQSTLIPWSAIAEVVSKEKDGHVSSLRLRTLQGGTIDLTDYARLDELRREVEHHLADRPDASGG